MYRLVKQNVKSILHVGLVLAGVLVISTCAPKKEFDYWHSVEDQEYEDEGTDHDHDHGDSDEADGGPDSGQSDGGKSDSNHLDSVGTESDRLEQ
ncbi:MAG: hypothetical protein GY847_36845 [Proteobacteria bacterium]|nr:hypothetical protein [Pseudomonadota bacterium]